MIFEPGMGIVDQQVWQYWVPLHQQLQCPGRRSAPLNLEPLSGIISTAGQLQEMLLTAHTSKVPPGGEDVLTYLHSGACLTPVLWQEFTRNNKGGNCHVSSSVTHEEEGRPSKQHPYYTLVWQTNFNPKQSLETYLGCSTAVTPTGDLRWCIEQWET